MKKRHDPSHDPSEMFKVLAVGTRLGIIEILKAHGPIGVSDIAEILGVTPAAVSQHLKLMRQAGLVTSERDGYRVPYSLDEEGLDSCCGMLIDVCSCGCHGEGERDCSADDLAALKRRKGRLEAELGKVNDRIARLRNK
ncbi:MAG: metalloregulator ArsR/SmtB family transcription factor [Candidatus Eisenbacteria bacterium]